MTEQYSGTVWHTGRPCGAGVFKYVKCCGLPSNEEVEKGASLARQTEIVNCVLREHNPYCNHNQGKDTYFL